MGSKSGKRTKTINVFTNDPENKTVKLKISADVNIVLAASPNRLYFGSFKKGETPIKYITLEGKDSVKTKITKVETAGKNKSFKIDIAAESTVEIQSKKIMLTALPDLKVGKLRERIIIHTDHEKIKKLTVYVNGEVKGNINIKPQYLSLGVLEKGKKVAKTIKLDASEGTSFKVLKVSSTESEIETEIETVEEGKTYRIKVSPIEGYTKNILKGDILIKTDNKEQKEIKVKFFGRFKSGKSRKKPDASVKK